MVAVVVPLCPTDALRMVPTATAWRCPVCGLAALRGRASARERAMAAHPSAR